MEMFEYNDLNLRAPDSFWGATEEEVDKHTGGCGPGRKGDALVPDKLLWLSIKAACRIHDWEYHIGETWEDKRLADLNFLINMLEINYKRSNNRFIRWLRDHLAFRYFLAVYYYGGSAFKK